MERKLSSLFDYQRFVGNKRLAALIADTESRYSAELSDDDLELVNAAGEISALPRKPEGNSHEQD